MAHGAADDAPEHVATLLVRRHDAVGDEERHRATVLGEDPQRHVALVTREAAVLDARDLLRGRDRAAGTRRCPTPSRRPGARRGSARARAGVDARRGERHELSVGLRVELHEHEVPDLDVPVLVGRPGRPSAPNSGPRSQKISEFGPHGPVSAMRQKLSSSPRRWMRSAGSPTTSRQIFSASSSVSWTVTHSAIGVEPEHLGDELPRPTDRLGLEVVAEAEVAQHLEEREVPVRAADVVEVVVLAAGAHALLAPTPRGGTAAALVADEVRLERHHARRP